MRFLDAVLAMWLAMGLLVDPLVTSWRVLVVCRLAGVLALLGARLTVPLVRAAAIPWLLGAAGAITAALAAWLDVRTGFATPYEMTPVLWWLALTALISPRARVAIALGMVWLAAYLDTAALAGLARWEHAVAIAVTSVATLGFAAMVSQRLWRLEHDLFESRRLGRFRLLSPIGHGGMNDVWLAWDEQRRREVALKLLHTEGAGSQLRRQFAREAEISQRVRSPHVCRVLHHNVTDDGFAYIAFEYLRGMDLDVLVHTFGPLEPHRAARLMRQACVGLGDAHAAGVVHRDVKPANLHCSDAAGDEDFVRILDFGVSRIRDETAAPLDGAVIGTPAYMSPEAFVGEDTTPASDVYSLGATFYFALTGVPPIDADSAAGYGQAHARAPIVPPSLRAQIALPRSFEKVVLRCLAKRPEDRFADASQVAAALDKAIHELGGWSREDAARWWHRARVGRVAGPVRSTEHTTDVEVRVSRLTQSRR